MKPKLLVLGSGVWLLAGCYVYVPAQTSMLAPGNEVALDVNDQGRVGLAGQMGPEIKRVAGKLVSHTDSGWVLNVTNVLFISGRDASWTGERVGISESFVNGVLRKNFSPSRTVGVLAATAGAVGAFIGAGILNVGGRSGGDPGGKPPPDQ